MIVTEEHLKKVAEAHYPRKTKSSDGYIIRLIAEQLQKAFVEGAMYAFKVADKNDSSL